MKYFITESHFKKYVSIISEHEEDDEKDYSYLDDYDDEDFIEVTLEYFRPWIKKNHGDEVGRYPLSYLLKKYFIEFCKHYNLDLDYDEYYSTSQLEYAGKEFIIKQNHRLPTLRPSFKFTEKYKKQIEYLINTLKLPNWLTFSFVEESPYNVEVTLNVNLDEFLKSSGDDNADEYYQDFVKFLESFMGVEQGNPVHGNINIHSFILYTNDSELTNPSKIKQIKSKIKSLNGGDRIHSIKMSFNSKRFDINLTFKSGYRYDYNSRNELREKILAMFKDMGYNEDRIRVSI
jgi:hypothetical protein